jgi:hypothetical protein|tara:strand:- start:7853 stop:8242 length:390 start_codon:yes stop_codon:yes gene_type:complete
LKLAYLAKLNRIIWIIAAVTWASLIFVFSSQSLPILTPGWLELPIIDKVVHACVFGILGIFLFLATKRTWLAIIIASFYGATDEWHQLYVDGRIADLWDWVADIVGTITAVCLLSLYRNKLRERVKWNP